MEFQYESNRIFAENRDHQLIGEIVFPAIDDANPSSVVVERTFVNPAFRGQNIAAVLVDEFVKYAEQHHLKVQLLCPYAKRQFEQQPDYQKLLKPEDRFN
ncbi:GNAT family N-acetyltransferase [Paucilactobacillus sp. N302-9]